MKKTEHTYEGVLVVDKESGPTSHDVIARFRRLWSMRRIGHCGTLDPLATGVLVIGLGRYTRLNQWLTEGEKEYLATFRLGGTSNTGDAQGEITPRKIGSLPKIERLEKEIKLFEGLIEQIPPAFSAIKVDGVRSYVRARRREEVVLAPRKVHINQIELLNSEYPLLHLRSVCSKGTYIRSLAVDLGERLGCGAYVQELRRTRVGNLPVEDALTLGEIGKAVEEGDFPRHLVPIPRALDGFPQIFLSQDQVRDFVHGISFVLDAVADADHSKVCVVYSLEGEFVGMGKWVDTGEDACLKPHKVFLSVPDSPIDAPLFATGQHR